MFLFMRSGVNLGFMEMSLYLVFMVVWQFSFSFFKSGSILFAKVTSGLSLGPSEIMSNYVEVLFLLFLTCSNFILSYNSSVFFFLNLTVLFILTLLSGISLEIRSACMKLKSALVMAIASIYIDCNYLYI
jgi:hypothetical protein